MRFETHALAKLDLIADDAVWSDETIVANPRTRTYNCSGINTRRVSGCSAGLSAKVAATVRDELSNRTTTAAPAAVETTTYDAADPGNFARVAA